MGGGDGLIINLHRYVERVDRDGGDEAGQVQACSMPAIHTKHTAASGAHPIFNDGNGLNEGHPWVP